MIGSGGVEDEVVPDIWTSLLQFLMVINSSPN